MSFFIVPCIFINVSAFSVLALPTVPSRACMKRRFQLKWCRAQHTAPHLAAYTRAGTTALRRRSDIRTKGMWFYSIGCSFCWLLLSLLSLRSLFVKRRKRSTGSSWLWSLVVSHLSFTMATLTPLWGLAEICTYTNEFMDNSCLWQWWYWNLSIIVVKTYYCYPTMPPFTS